MGGEGRDSQTFLYAFTFLVGFSATFAGSSRKSYFYASSKIPSILGGDTCSAIHAGEYTGEQDALFPPQVAQGPRGRKSEKEYQLSVLGNIRQ